MKNNKIRLVLEVELLIILLFGITFLIIPQNVQRNNIIVYFTLGLNGTCWLYLLVNEVQKHAFSMAMMHWCFCLLFFFFAVLVQYTNDAFPWVKYRDDEILVTTNFILFLWTIGIWIGQHIKKTKKYPVSIKKIDCTKYAKICVVLMSLIAFWRIKTVGFTDLLARSTAESKANYDSISMLVDHTMQAGAYMVCIISIIAFKQIKKLWPYALCCTVLMVIAYPPSGMARYAAAAIYFGILLTFSDKLREGRLFIFIFMGSFSIILPLLNAFRLLSFDNVDIITTLSKVIHNFSNEWLAGDYDAYTMLTLAVQDIQENGILWGRQLIGGILFFVPRSLWKDKPVGTGHQIATNLHWNFTNLSCPLPAEAIMNFGYIGVIVFAIVIGYIVKEVDNSYWNIKKRSKNKMEFYSLELLYPVSTIFFFYMCRGDFMSSYSYVMAYIMVWAIISWWMNKKIVIK